MAAPKQYHLPLPKPVRDSFRSDVEFKDGANAGLVWQRFFNGYQADFSTTLDIKEARDKQTKAITVEAQNGKADFVRKFALQRKVDDAFVLRQKSLIELMGGAVRQFQTQGHFATGMGNDHPTENGFTWHHTLGAPYLPASSVKGLVRGWIEWNGEKHAHHARLKEWFGSQTKMEVSKQAGWFVFFDALPTEPVLLAADVMTPHYDKWYEQGGEIKSADEFNVVPADWHSPIPVIFLTVKKATFQFGVAVRAGLTETNAKTAHTELSLVLYVLQEALEWAGAGAKTATGYGRMLPEKGAAMAQQTTTGDWQECVVKYNAGKQVLSVIIDGKAVECKREDSARFMQTCSPENVARWKKDKLVNANIKISTLGNLRQVVELEWLPVVAN